MFENIVISLVLVACIYYLIKQLWPNLDKNSAQKGACGSCASTCHTDPQ